MESRIDISRVWVKSVKKSSESADLTDGSSLNGVWSAVRETGLSQSRAQEAFATALVEINVVLEAQIVEVKKSKTALHAAWQKSLADVKKKQLLHDKARDAYHDAVKQAETAVMNRDAAHDQKQTEKSQTTGRETGKGAGNTGCREYRGRARREQM